MARNQSSPQVFTSAPVRSSWSRSAGRLPDSTRMAYRAKVRER